MQSLVRPSDAIFDCKSSQCWINVESASDVSQVHVVQLWGRVQQASGESLLSV